jgi:molybdate transport system permease protein
MAALLWAHRASRPTTPKAAVGRPRESAIDQSWQLAGSGALGGWRVTTLIGKSVGTSTAPARRLRVPVLGPSVLLAAVLSLFLGLPLIGLLLRAAITGGLFEAFRRPIVFEAVRLSMITTVLVVILTLIFGSPLALLLARRRVRGISLLDTLVDLPIVLPPAVAGLALLLTFGRRGLLGPALSSLGIELPFTTAAVVVASLFVAAPFYVRAARSGFLAVPREYEEAARVEGAAEWQVFRYVTIPIAAPALFGGAILCWARALGEFGATIMFAGQFLGRTQTMPLAIYAALESDTDAALGLSVLLLVISSLLLLVFRRFLRGASEGI